VIRVDIANLQRTLEQIVSAIESLNKAVNKPSTKEKKADSKEKIRVIEKADGEYKIEFKTEKGWIESDSSSQSGFKRKL